MQMYIWNMADRFSKYHGNVIMFHNITDESIETLESCKCKVAVFEQILLDKLNKSQIISIDDMLRIIECKRFENFTVITFDDIPETVYTNAFPLLKKYNIPFTIFVSTEFVNRKGFVTLEQLKQMAECPLCTIGAHSDKHIMLRKCENIKDQLVKNKLFLETHIDKAVEYLAYPYGRYESVSKRAQKIAKEVGFKCAFSTIQSTINQMSSRNLYFLPRLIENKL